MSTIAEARGLITLECYQSPHCSWKTTDDPESAEISQARHERRHGFLPRARDVEASPAWRAPYRETNTAGDHK